MNCYIPRKQYSYADLVAQNIKYIEQLGQRKQNIENLLKQRNGLMMWLSQVFGIHYHNLEVFMAQQEYLNQAMINGEPEDIYKAIVMRQQPNSNVSKKGQKLFTKYIQRTF